METFSEKIPSCYYFLTHAKKITKGDSEVYIKRKFFTLKRLLVKNNTFSQNDKNNLFEVFEKSQKALFGFYYLKMCIRNKKLKQYDCNTDLNFNCLDEIPNNKKVCIIDSNIIYNFSLLDIVNIVNNSLSYHYDFFAEPAVIKNPYTNLEFSFGALLKMYHAFESSPIKTPILFDRYYKVFFDIDLFEKENETLIREYNIKHFMRASSTMEKVKRIKEMLDFYNRTQDMHYKIKVDKLFPKSELVNIFEKFLFTYMNTLQLGSAIKCSNKRKLIIGLRAFHNENSHFGRRIVFLKINKLKEYSEYIYSTPGFLNFYNYYIPPPQLIDIKNKSYFVSERHKNVSIFSMELNNNSLCSLIKKKDLDNIFMFKHPNTQSPPESTYLIPQLSYDELYNNKRSYSQSQNNTYNIDDSDDDDEIFESHFFNMRHVINDVSDTDSDDESNSRSEREPSVENDNYEENDNDDDENTLLDEPITSYSALSNNFLSNAELDNMENTIIEDLENNMDIDINSEHSDDSNTEIDEL